MGSDAPAFSRMTPAYLAPLGGTGNEDQMSRGFEPLQPGGDGPLTNRWDGPLYLRSGMVSMRSAGSAASGQPMSYSELLTGLHRSANAAGPKPSVAPRNGAAEKDKPDEKKEKDKEKDKGKNAKPGADGEPDSARPPGQKEGAAGGHGAKGNGGTGKKAKATRPRAAVDASGDTTEPEILQPAIAANQPSLIRAPVRSVDGGESFRPIEPPAFRAPQQGGKPEPPRPDRARAVALFRETVAQSARLYAAFMALAQQATSSVRDTEAGLASLARGDLDRGLSSLRSGLDKAQQELDRRADATDSFVEMRRVETYLGITAAANAALGALNALKKDADKTFSAHDGERIAAGKVAEKKQDAVTGAGSGAATSVTGLDTTKEADHPMNIAPMASAINEAIDMRLPERSKLRAKTYTDERDAQDAHLSKTFAQMKGDLDKQFTAIRTAMNETAKGSADSIIRSRDAARKQLAKGAHGMHRSVAQARERGHAALISQHNSLRLQMIASHRDRALRETTLAQQRSARGTAAALNAAKAQQAGINAMGEALAREAGRPPDDLAKVIAASAGGLLRQIAKGGPEQRDRLDRSVKAGEDDARVQSHALSGRLAASAETAGEQLRSASRNAADSLDNQTRLGTAPFDEIPGQVTAALRSAYPSTRTAYLAQNEGTPEKPGAGQLISSAQAAIDATIAGEGGGKDGGQSSGNAPPAGDAKGPREKPAAFRDRAKAIEQAPNSDEGIKALIATANSDIPPRVENKVGPLYNALMATSTNVESVMAELRGLTKQQGRALSDAYATKEGGRDLAADLKSELEKFFSDDYTNEQNIAAALAYLAGNTVDAADHELKATVYLWNDTGRAEKVLRALTPKQLDDLNKAHPETMADVSGDLSESEKKIFDRLKEIKPLDNLQGEALVQQRTENYRLLGIANAHALKRDIDDALETKGEAGGDKAADTVANAFQGAGSDAISGGDGAYEDPSAAEARRKAVWQNTQDSFASAAPILPDGTYNVGIGDNAKLGAIARYAAAKRNRTEFVPDDGPDGGHWESVQKGLDPKQARLIDDIAKTGPNSDDTAASTIDFETNRKEGKPREDRLRKALLGEDLMGAREESDADRAKRMADSKNEKGEVISGDLARAKERKANILKKVAERQAEGKQTGDGKPAELPPPDQVQKQITDQLDVRFAGDPTGAAYTKSMIESETLQPDPKKAFDFALAHDERNKETLKATTERMNRDDIKKAVAEWDDGKPPSERLYARLGLYGHDGKLEGDARNDTEIAFRGKPRNEKEKALVAIMVVEQQRRDSGATGRALAHGEYDRMTAEQAKVLGYLGVTRDQIDETGDIKANGPDGKPITGNFDPVTGKLNLDKDQRADFESAMRFSHMDAESYKQAVDRISQGIVMALIVAAAIITTFVTFGGAAAIWGPILITAAAGFAGMGMTALIRGDRYTSAEIQRDFVMTLVQAATAGLGAGLGAAAKGAGAAGKGAVTALEDAAAIEKGMETAGKMAGAGEKLAAAGTGAASKEGLTFGAKALQFGKDVVIAGGTNSINSFAAAAMDPENRRQGTALSKAVDGGIKGFLSGSLGAAVTKPFSALGRSLGGAGERIAGSVGSGFVTRLADARIGQAMGDPHQSWAESIEGAKEGIAQDAIRAFGEHHAEQSAERVHARTARAAAGREAGPELDTSARRRGAADQPAPDAAAPRRGVADEAGEGAVRVSVGEEPTPAPRRSAADEAERGTVRVPVSEEPTPLPHERSVLTEEPGPLLRPGHGEEEPIAKLRAAGHDDFDKEEITQPIKRMRLADLLESTEPRPAPIFDRVDITPEMLAGKRSIPEHSVIRAADDHDPVAARRNYDAMRLADPHREVLLAHNPATGEYMVIQGKAHEVEPPPQGWITERHSHPRIVSEVLAERLVTSLPSATGGDYTVLRRELDHAYGTVTAGTRLTRSSVIDINVNGVHTETHFSITRQGDAYELTMSFRPPHDGISMLGPFHSIDEYASHATALTGTDFANPKEGSLRAASAGEAAPRRVLRGEQLDPVERGNALFVGESVARAEDFHAQRQGARRRGDIDPMLGEVASVGDAHERVHAMGLVNEPGAMVRLAQILDDESIPLAARERVAQATLAATREALISSGNLAAGDDVVMLFRGVKADRLADYQREGIDLAKVDRSKAANEDAGHGLYGSQDLESARNYAGKNDRVPPHEVEGGIGMVLPLIVRTSELGNVVDVRSGTPLGDRWLAFVQATATKIRIFSGYEHLNRVLKPGLDMPLAVERDGRGARYDRFLAEIAQDPTLPPPVRAAAADPHITLMDLGGVASTGNDRHILTDQWAMHSQHIADLFNEAMGFPIPGREVPAATTSDEGDSGVALRSVRPGKPDAMNRLVGNLLNDLEGAPVGAGTPLSELMRAAPETLTGFFSSVARAARRGDTPEPTEAILMRMTLEMRARGMPADLVSALREQFMTLAQPDHPVYLRVAGAGIHSDFHLGLAPVVDVAVSRRGGFEMARRFGYNDAPGADRQQVRTLLHQDKDAVVRLIASSEGDRTRVMQYAHARVTAGVPQGAAMREGFALLRIVKGSRFEAVQDRINEMLGRANINSRTIAELVRERPETLLHLAYANPQQLGELYADLVFKRMSQGRFAPPSADQLAGYVSRRMISNLLPVASESSVVFSLHEMGLNLLKADAVQRGGANRPGLDIVAFGLLPGEDPATGGRVRVLIADDKAYRMNDPLGINELQGVSAMNGGRYARNLDTTALEIRAEIVRLRLLPGLAGNPEYAAYFAGGEAAAGQMEKAAQAIRMLPLPPSDPQRTQVMRSQAYTRAIASIMATHAIDQVVTSRHGNVNELAVWLRNQGFVLEDEYVRRLAAILAFHR